MCVFLLSFDSLAREFSTIQQSPRAILMGNAYTTQANDAFTLFYNPATLGRHKGFTLYPFNPMFTATNPLGEMDRFEGFDSSDTTDLIDRLTGFPLHLGIGLTPGFKMGNFGFSLVSNTQTTMTLLNNTHPMLDIQNREDRGFVTGYAFKLTPELSLGMSIKYIKRRGLMMTSSVYSTRIIDLMDADIDSISSIMRGLGQQQGNSWGADLGLEYYKKTGNTEIIWGISAMDIGDTYFKQGDTRVEVPVQKMNISTGISMKQSYGPLLDYTLSADVVRLNHRIDHKLRYNLGFEAGTPVVRVLGGMSSGYLSYGAQVNLGLISIYAGLYEVELGYGYKQQKNQRALLYLSLFDFHFDV